MKLTVVAASTVSKWKVVAVVEERNGERRCALEEQLAAFEAQPKQGASVAGLQVLWDRIPKVGPREFPDHLYHLVDEKNGIYEFIKGRLRVLCFEADGAVCVCSTVFLKQTAKTPKDEVRKAIALKEQYLRELKEGGVSYEQ